MASESFSASEILKAPPIVKGWMRKQGRKGLIKNWKRRFFVVTAGKLSYYSQEIKEFPYGEDLKGELNLVRTELELQEENGKQQIHIISFNGENNLLIETETEAETDRWTEALKQHMKFAANQSFRSSQRYHLSVADIGVGTGAGRESSSLSRRPSSSVTTITAISTLAQQQQQQQQSAPSSSPGINSSNLTADNYSCSSPLSPPPSSSLLSSNRSNMNSSQPQPQPQSQQQVEDDNDRDGNHNIVDSSLSFSSPIQAMDYFLELFVRLFTQPEYRQTVISKKMIPAYTIASQTFVNQIVSYRKLQSSSQQSSPKLPRSRGEGGLVLAIVMLTVLILSPVIPSRLLLLLSLSVKITSYLSLFLGLFLFLSAIYELRENCSPFLHPIVTNNTNRSHHRLITTSGVYALVRHPLYGGLYLVCLSIAMVCSSAAMGGGGGGLKGFLSLCLSYLLDQAIRLEEEMLTALHPTEYSLYCQRVRRKLIPFLY